jgi:phosphoribosylcarboxyaminoimidazole (NCAIR) mutase
LAAQILATNNEELATKLVAYKKQLEQEVMDMVSDIK